MKPQILSMTQDSGAGITPSSQPQSIQILGTGFKPGMILIDEGPDPHNRSKVEGQVAGPAPQYKRGLTVFNETNAAAVLAYPIDTNGPHQALVIVDGVASDWFPYSVG